MSFGAWFEIAMRKFEALGGFVVIQDNVVFAMVRHGDNVEFSTAVCAPHDTFIDAVGMAIAIERFMDKKTVTVPRYMVDFM